MKNLLSLAIIVLLITGGCKKNDPAAPNSTGKYDFNYSTDPKAGDSVRFTAINTSSTDIRWTFGFYIGDTITGANVTRYFPKQGTFKVNMIVDGDTTKRVTKDIKVNAYDISFLDKDWYWTGIHIKWGLNTPSDTTAIDTFMERIIVVDDTTVQFDGSKFYVERVVPQEERIYFKEHFDYYWRQSLSVHKNNCYYFRTGGSNGGYTVYMNTVQP
jgi:hypothetical protein